MPQVRDSPRQRCVSIIRHLCSTVDDEEARSTIVGLWLAWTIAYTPHTEQGMWPALCQKRKQIGILTVIQGACGLPCTVSSPLNVLVAKQVWLQYPLPPNRKGRGTASLVNHHTALAALSVSDKIRLYCTPLLQAFLAAPDLFTRANSLAVDEPRALAMATRVSEKPPNPSCR